MGLSRMSILTILWMWCRIGSRRAPAYSQWSVVRRCIAWKASLRSTTSRGSRNDGGEIASRTNLRTGGVRDRDDDELPPS